MFSILNMTFFYVVLLLYYGGVQPPCDWTYCLLPRGASCLWLVQCVQTYQNGSVLVCLCGSDSLCRRLLSHPWSRHLKELFITFFFLHFIILEGVRITGVKLQVSCQNAFCATHQMHQNALHANILQCWETLPHWRGDSWVGELLLISFGAPLCTCK